MVMGNGGLEIRDGTWRRIELGLCSARWAVIRSITLRYLSVCSTPSQDIFLLTPERGICGDA